jgi:2,5-diamino-6-(ribosylamino)-4(3H)-pyrimidinone 5'-phosphate reductase
LDTIHHLKSNSEELEWL